MKKHIKTPFLFLFGLLSLSLTSCFDDWGIKGEGPVISEERSLEPFKRVQNALSADVYIRQGPQEEIRIEAQENILNNIITKVRNGRLEMGFDENVRRHDGIKIWITIPEVRELSVSGSGALYSEGQIEAEELELNISGSGDARLLAMVDYLEANISGSGKVKLEGQANELNFRVSGSGEIDALGMPAKVANVHISGSGDCFLEVHDRLDVSISGSGDVSYRGQPVVNSSISGSGNLKHLD